MDDPTPELYYAGWWRRFVAFWIDILLFSPLLLLHIYLGHTPLMSVGLMILMGTLFHGYEIYSHGKWGKTLGKLLTGTRVATFDGDPISWRQALFRNAVAIFFFLLGWFVLLSAYIDIPIDEWKTLAWNDRHGHATAYRPFWAILLYQAENIWVWSEFIVVLLNRRRQALHDIIAKTVVLQHKPNRGSALFANQTHHDLGKQIERFRS